MKPGGRVLIQQMSRSGGRDGHPGGGPFIESFIAPDMHMRPVGETVAFLERGGLEVRDVHALREHYVRTVEGWLENFAANLDRLTELVGEEVVRVWRLYLVGGAMAFRDGRMGVDQILMVRPGADAHASPRQNLVNVSLPVVLLASLGAVVVLMTITALVSRRVGRVSVVDVTWGLGFVVVAAVGAALGDEPVRWLLLAMVGVWGLRLGWHIGKRQLGHPEEDPRYAKMLGDGGFGAAVRRVFLVQGLAIWFVSLPVQVAAVTGTRWTWLVWVGVAVWLVGMRLRVGRRRPAVGVQEGPGSPSR